MKPEEVASYLKQHPEFFEDYAEALAEIYISHPHGGRAISISERQILTLRDRAKQLEGKLREVIQFGEENDAIGEKVHRFSVALITSPDMRGVLNAVYSSLSEDFAVPHVVLRAWQGSAPTGTAELGSASDATREFANNLSTPQCGADHAPEGVTSELFGDSASLLKSFAYIPLRGSDTYGLLAFASEDAERFYPEMGTVYLKRIGDMVGAALLRNLDVRNG